MRLDPKAKRMKKVASASGFSKLRVMGGMGRWLELRPPNRHVYEESQTM